MYYKNGLVIGKFMPPHKGHEYLFRFAKQYCENLTIVVDCIEGQTILPELRKQWIEELVTGVKVIALKDFMPQDPSEVDNFWEIWRNTLYNVAGKPDVLIAAMDYGWELSKQLDCHFIPLDIARQSIPISATEIRNNPLQHWDFIVESARGHFLKKICFIGPESTGKSTIGEKIAKHFKTVYIPEYAKAIIAQQSGQFYESNVVEVAYAQIRTEKSLERMTNKVMICDSDIIVTMAWSQELFGHIPSQLIQIAQTQHYDKTFLFYPDTPWISDTHRNVIESSSQEFRIKMFLNMEKLLKQFNRDYEIIYGSYQQKEETIEKYINALIINEIKEQ